MSRSVSAPSSVTKTSPCWNGFMVPGSTFRYGSSFCIVTRRPRALSSAPRLDAVRPLPREEATPPVTKMCLVVEDLEGMAKTGLPWSRFGVRAGCLTRAFREVPSLRFGGPLASVSASGAPTGPRATRVSAPGRGRFRPRSAHGPTRGTVALTLPTHPAQSLSREGRADHHRASYPARTIAAEPGRTTAPPRPYSPDTELVSSFRNDNHCNH